ncbi:MAG: exodeoxyribonuclease VII large subunit, partial [Legionella sp. 21-45-4]
MSLYEARGDYQLIVESVSQSGIGDLYRAYLALKGKLAAAGLFDLEQKKPIPSTPRCIGIITSANGAALHDILTTIKRRYPIALTKLYPCDVQGNLAAAQLIAAIQRANQEQRVDVIILARGGGSLEDLWPFNNEALAYAIAESCIPIVSGVGHETDFTIADFVADLRAATPTAAAEAVTPDWQQFQQQIASLNARLHKAMARLFAIQHLQLESLNQRLIAPRRLVNTHWQTLDYLTRQLNHAQNNLLKQKRLLI